jgi:Flp pilus assembly protein TadG
MRGNRRPKREAGQSLVEFAVGALVLVLLVAGAGEIGRAFYFAVAIQGASREAARSAIWFSPGDVGTPNPDLSDSAILASVNDSLAGSGLVAGFRSQSGCLEGQDGNGYHNPPYADAAYPTDLNTAAVYACYQKPGSSVGTGTLATPDASYVGGEVQVSVLVAYGLATGLLRDQFGSGIHLVSTSHMRIQGAP